MRKLNPARLLLPLALLCALASSAVAQTPVDARAALSTFPDSQVVLFVNAHRIINEVMPRAMTKVEYQKLIDETKKVGFDVRGLQFAAAGIRFKDDAPAGAPPEFVIVIKGNFNADSLLALSKIMMAAKDIPSRTETYGSKTIEIIDADALNKAMNKGDAPEGADGVAPKPKPLPYSEFAVTALDSNTLVAGVPAFVRSAVDASGGQGALRPSLLSLAAQDPDAIWSLTAELPPNVAELAHNYGLPASPQFDEMVGWVKQLSVAQGMNALDFTLGVAVTTDQPEHASAFSGLVRMGQTFADNMLRDAVLKSKGADAAKARQALAVLSSVVNRAEGDTLFLRVSVPQKVVLDMIKDERVKVIPRNTSKYLFKKPARKPRRRARRR